jgi:SH3 domain protein
LLQETEHLRNVAAKPLALSDENEVLSKKTQSQEEKLNALIDQMQQLRDESNKQWFLTGAGVVLAGMLIGILIPRLRRHRQSDWAATLR